MRAVVIRTFRGRYQVPDRLGNPLIGRDARRPVDAARTFLLVLGLSFAGVGIFLASAVDPLIGLGVLVVGAFLLILPFAALGPEE